MLELGKEMYMIEQINDELSRYKTLNKALEEDMNKLKRKHKSNVCNKQMEIDKTIMKISSTSKLLKDKKEKIKVIKKNIENNIEKEAKNKVKLINFFDVNYTESDVLIKKRDNEKNEN